MLTMGLHCPWLVESVNVESWTCRSDHEVIYRCFLVHGVLHSLWFLVDLRIKNHEFRGPTMELDHVQILASAAGSGFNPQ